MRQLDQFLRPLGKQTLGDFLPQAASEAVERRLGQRIGACRVRFSREFLPAIGAENRRGQHELILLELGQSGHGCQAAGPQGCQ